MKKIILTFVAITVMLFTTDAQTKKGTVLLGAGSQFSDTEWTQWSITPKIGYFIQDGLAIGAMVHFDSDDEYYPELLDREDRLPMKSPIHFDFGFIYAINESFRIGLHFQQPWLAFYWKI